MSAVRIEADSDPIDAKGRRMSRKAEDPVWEEIRREVRVDVDAEPMLAGHLHATILKHKSLEDALSFHLAGRLGSSTIHEMTYREVIEEAFESDPEIGRALRADLLGVRERDPACRGFATAFLYFKGFHALQSHRVAHWLWCVGREALALHMQSRNSERFAVDIHPAARIGKGILIDHATGVVIGETAVIEDNVSILHEVTLGGTGKQTGDRHPKIRAGVLLGAGAKILGNIEVGRGAKVAAGSVVLENVPPHSTVAGVPATVVGRPKTQLPALEMDQSLSGDQALMGGLGI
jgi:serine O-acetyltransferase